MLVNNFGDGYPVANSLKIQWCQQRSPEIQLVFRVVVEKHASGRENSFIAGNRLPNLICAARHPFLLEWW